MCPAVGKFFKEKIGMESMSLITKLFGTHSERELKRIQPLVDKVLSYDEAMQALSDDELRAKTKEYQ